MHFIRRMVSSKDGERKTEKEKEKKEACDNVFRKFNWTLFKHPCEHAIEILKAKEQSKTGDDDDDLNAKYLSKLSKPPEEYEAESLGNLAEKLWFQELKSAKQRSFAHSNSQSQSQSEADSKKGPSLMRVMLKLIAWDFIKLSLFLFIERSLVLLSIFELLKRSLKIIDQLQLFGFSDLLDESPKLNKNLFSPINGTLLENATTTIAVDLREQFFIHQRMYYQLLMMAGLICLLICYNQMSNSITKFLKSCLALKMRVALTQLIHRKSLRLSLITSVRESSSSTTNLVSNEITIIEGAKDFIMHICLGPLVFFGATSWIAISQTGWIPVLSIYPIMLVLLLLQMIAPKIYKNIICKRVAETRLRVDTTSNFLNSIKVAKMYSWETIFKNLIDSVRDRESMWLKKMDTLVTIEMVLISTMMKLLPTVTFLSYIYLYGTISADILFTVVMCYGNMTFDSLFGFYASIRGWIDVMTSLSKIQQYLQLPEIQPTIQSYKSKSNCCQVNCEKLQISYKQSKRNDDAAEETRSIERTSDGINMVIDNLSVQMNQGELILVLGQVGSGKSSFLLSLLGEIEPSSGRIIMKEEVKISYATQEPWITAQSIRENILFGRPLDQKRYQQVIEVCSLRRDLSLLPRGDETLLGSKGVSLSGGQKARVNLARAVYADADIYLLDDPLSAVDSKVSKHIFNECLRKFLKNKLIVLATHQRQYLQRADKVIILERPEAIVGSPEEVASRCRGYLSNSNGSSQALSGAMATIGKEFTDDQENKTIDELCSDRGENAKLDLFQRGNLRTKLMKRVEDNYKRNRKSNYLLLVKLGVSWLLTIITILSLVIYTPLNAYTDYYLKVWQDIIMRDRLVLSASEMTRKLFFGCAVYFGLAVLNGIFAASLQLSILTTLRRSTSKLHQLLMASLFSARMSFFDFCPPGQLGTRYAADFTQIDHVLKPLFLRAVQFVTFLVGFSIMLLFIQPLSTMIFVVSFMLMGPKAMRAYKRYIKLDNLSKSLRAPVYTNLTLLVDELDTIRSNKLYVEYNQREFNRTQNNLTTVSMLAAQYEARVSAAIKSPLVVITAVAFYILFYIERESLNSALTGSYLMMVINICLFFPAAIELMSVVDSLMNSVESVQQLIYLETEEERQRVLTGTDAELRSQPSPEQFQLAIQEAKRPRRNIIWQRGQIEFKQVTLRYFEDEQPVLKQLCFTIEGCKRVGVIGRTGAGKSSIVSVLFRLYPFEGSVLIDEFDTKQLGLSELRASLGVIPQDPVLFCDSLRKNLDPFGEYDDQQIWRALEVVQLKQHVASNLPAGLDHLISEGGRNFSVGQRQLVCLARAVLKRPKVLVMDEATANVDQDTDELIQETIKRHFAGSTVVTIAHRLNTILDYDRVLVLDAGEVVEYDTVECLLAKEDGVFKSMLNARREVKGD